MSGERPTYELGARVQWVSGSCCDAVMNVHVHVWITFSTLGMQRDA